MLRFEGCSDGGLGFSWSICGCNILMWLLFVAVRLNVENLIYIEFGISNLFDLVFLVKINCSLS